MTGGTGLSYRPAETRMRAALAQGPATARVLAERAGMSRHYAGIVLGLLEAAGEAEHWKRPGTRSRVWRLTPHEGSMP